MFRRQNKSTIDSPKPMSTFSKIILAVFLVSAVGLTIWQFHVPTWTVTLKGQELTVLVAKNQKHRFTGLGGRETIEPYDGMIFVYPLHKKQGIVMRDMQFPIDIVWFNGGLVVDIAPSVPIEPGRSEEDLTVYYPRLPSNVVIELPAGWAAANALQIGDRLEVVED